MNTIIRKISIGRDYKINAMKYAVGQLVYNGHTIINIVEYKDKYTIFIEKDTDVLPWKDISKNCAVVVEFDMEY